MIAAADAAPRRASSSLRSPARFVIFATPRSASTTFVMALEKARATMLFETLNAAHAPMWLYNGLGFANHSQVTHALPRFMERLWNTTPPSIWCQASAIACGFKLFPTHLRPPATLHQLFVSGGGGGLTHAIVLRRLDAQAQYESLKRAAASGDWGNDGQHDAVGQHICLRGRDSARCANSMRSALHERFFRPPKDLPSFMREHDVWHAAVNKTAARAHVPILTVYSEDLNGTKAMAETIRSVMGFLGVSSSSVETPRGELS